MAFEIPGLPVGYADKIYGAVLGKVIGVRLGNPTEFHGTSQELQAKYPYVNTYVENDRNIYADDDTNGFVFFGKMFERISYDLSALTPELVAQTIMNYAAESRGFFWWEDSTESGVFHHLQQGVSPTVCGDYKYIGKSVNNVGGQIFYDAIGIIFAGNPEKAAECAGICARVMHNGEGAIGGQFISACISAAFVENDMHCILKRALKTIKPDSRYAFMVRDIMDFYDKNPYDWRMCQHQLDNHYPYHRAWDYGSHIIMALLYGRGDFSYSVEICLLSAGDTDCNCGNVGAIVGALVGAKAISYHNWIEPLHDTLYCSGTVPYENEVSITQFTALLMKLYAKFSAHEFPNYLETASKLGVYSFIFPYSYQKMDARLWRDGKERTDIVNRHNLCVNDEVDTPSGSPFSIKVWADCVKAGDCIRVFRWFNTGTGFLAKKSEGIDCTKYEPTSATRLYPGQTVRVRVMSRYNTAEMNVCLLAYSSRTGEEVFSEQVKLEARRWTELELHLPDLQTYYDCINVQMTPTQDSYYANGYDGIDLYLDELRIEGKPEYRFDHAGLSADIENRYWYTLLQNFNVCYGDVEANTSAGQDHLWFYPAVPRVKDEDKDKREFWITRNGKYTLALTGPYVQDCRVFCDVSLMPVGEKPDAGVPDADHSAALMVFAARGAVQHYAAGFYFGKIAILKADSKHGCYQVLCSADFDYDLSVRYHFKIRVSENRIRLEVSQAGNSENKTRIVWHGNGVLAGCIGFASIGDLGVRVYSYGISG